MISRARSLVVTTPNSCLFSSSPKPNRDSAILERLHHKDWLTPKEVTNLVNSLTHPSSALTLFNLYSSRKDYNPTEPFCTSLITKLAQAKLFDPIHTLLQRLKLDQNPQQRRHFSDEFFFTLIRVYAHVFNRIDRAVETLFDMPSFGSWPSTRTFNSVLNILVNAKLYEVAHEVYVAGPTRLGVEVDACSLNILIKGLCGCGKLEDAFKVFDEFPKMGCEPNLRTFSTLMHGLCERGMVDDAFGLLERMERSGVCADAVVFNILIGGLRKQGRVEEGKEMLERMMGKGCYPNESSYQEVLYGLLDAQRFCEARGVMERMVLKGFGPSFVSYKVMIKGLCKSNLVGDVDWALRQMVKQGFVPRMGMWKQIVKCVVSQETGSGCVSFDGILN
ncbi:pentatricopeptide repeat-containing protein At3g14580, mitochondrial [Gastrolobium bilobum]|uniref:pentatricopeptide repeat-containing protein At3g14580, mitochondrial n=1 Tax=Gastrolobium bilobum TaxID=150636 RepID=UPI002AB310F2|nr:pentatricopeptide repeat-containing protein At3g14580, mitochondrial [Gastrolobium bilobum]